MGSEMCIRDRMLQGTPHRTLQGFMTTEFSRVSVRVAKEICEKADLRANSRPKSIAREESDRLFKAINATKLMRPPTDCIAPIGDALLLQILEQNWVGKRFCVALRNTSKNHREPFATRSRRWVQAVIGAVSVTRWTRSSIVV